jgi:hypothetical protein
VGVPGSARFAPNGDSLRHIEDRPARQLFCLRVLKAADGQSSLYIDLLYVKITHQISLGLIMILSCSTNEQIRGGIPLSAEKEARIISSLQNTSRDSLVAREDGDVNFATVMADCRTGRHRTDRRP